MNEWLRLPPIREREGMREERKNFVFEKKKQKTFDSKGL
jgi:hypothetical protein